MMKATNRSFGKRIAVATALALAGVMLTGAVSSQAAPPPDTKIGKRIIITGCLHKGVSEGSYVLLGVTERPADTSAPVLPVPIAIYWFDSVEKMAPFVGEMVDITGTVTARGAKPGSITVSIDPTLTLDQSVQIKSGGMTSDKNAQNSETRTDVTTKDYDVQASGRGVQSVIETERPVYKLVVDDVDNVRLIPSADPTAACE